MTLRDWLQWPDGVRFLIHAATAALALATLALVLAVRFDGARVLLEWLFTLSIVGLACNAALAFAQRGRTRDLLIGLAFCLAVIPMGLLYWMLCFAAGLGGERCWWF